MKMMKKLKLVKMTKNELREIGMLDGENDNKVNCNSD